MESGVRKDEIKHKLQRREKRMNEALSTSKAPGPSEKLRVTVT